MAVIKIEIEIEKPPFEDALGTCIINGFFQLNQEDREFTLAVLEDIVKNKKEFYVKPYS